MIILSANKLTKSYGVETILSEVDFHINSGDRVGIIGVNGAGKTTLLNILAGDLTYDSGDIFRAPGIRTGYLRQSDALDSQNTVYEEMLSIFRDLLQMEKDMAALAEKIAACSTDGADVEKMLHDYDDMTELFSRRNGYGYKSEITGILNSLAFPPEYYDKTIAMLSGGERTRLALAALLLEKPDLLLLDEPTNHLDIDTLKWLEQYLKSYSGTIVLISHDRYFLDQTVTRVFEIENRRLYSYTGNYTAYAEKKKDRETAELRHYEKQQKEISKQEEMIRRFKQHGTEKLAKRAQSREKRLAHLEILDRPASHAGRIRFNFKAGPLSGRDALSVTDIGKTFGRGPNSRSLFEHVSFDIKRGERVCLVGPNGVGKTTLLKIILSHLPLQTGHIKIGHNIIFGYYDQNQELLDYGNTVLGELHSAYRLYTETELRSLLGRFLFRNDDVFKTVGLLSGGEKARLSLLKLMISGANFLIMDEPTNHLDINSKELVEDALLDFPGTMLLVSHDRYFLNKVPTRIMELSPSGIANYLGSYDYYMEKKFENNSPKAYLADMARQLGGGGVQAAETDRGRLTEKEQRIEERRREKELQTALKRREKELARLEGEIAGFENRISEIEAMMCMESVFSDHEKTSALNDELMQAKSDLSAAYDSWMALQD